MNIQSKKLFSPTAILYIFLVAFSISPVFAFDSENRNLFLIGIMAFSPFIILWRLEYDFNDVLLFLFTITIVLFPLLFNPETMRWSTVMYTIMFCLTFIAYKRLLPCSAFSSRNYKNLLKYLIYAYAIVLVIQQISVLTGLPILNLRFYNPADPWKLNSLGAEPSWSGRIIGILMYCYIVMNELVLGRKYNFRKDFSKDRWIWIGFIWSMITMGSATAFLFLMIVLSKFMRIRNLVSVLIIFILIISLVNAFGLISYERTYKIFMATLSFDEQAIIRADHSASFRIVPHIVLAKMITVTTFEGWFGHGVDYVSQYIDLVIPGSKNMSGGGLLAVFIEYGFIPFILFIVFSMYSTICKNDIVSFLLWFLLVFSYGLNVQIPWLAIMLLYTNKYFQRKKNNPHNNKDPQGKSHIGSSLFRKVGYSIRSH